MGNISVHSSTTATVYSTVAAVTSASFTPPANSRIYVTFAGNTNTATDTAPPTITDNRATKLNYELLKHGRRSDGNPTCDRNVSVFTAVVTTSQAMTITVTNSSTSSGAAQSTIKVWVMVDDSGAVPQVGASAKGAQNSGTAVAAAYAALATGSMAVGIVDDWDAAGVPTAGSNTTFPTAGDAADQGAVIAYAHARRTTADGVRGSTNGINATLPVASANLGWVVTEVAPSNAQVPPRVYAVGAVASGTATVAPAIPAGTTTDDILVLIAENDNLSGASIPAMTGWADITGSPVAMTTAQTTKLTVRWKRAGASETAPTVGDPGDHVIARIIGIRGCITTGNPWDVTNTGTETTSDTSASFPTVTTTVANTLVMNFIATGADLAADSTAQYSAWTNASLTDLTEQVDNALIIGNGGTIGAASGVKAVAGAVSATTATLVTAATKAMMTVAFKPAASTTTVTQDLDLRWAVGTGLTMPSPTTVVDNFDDNSIDTSKWANWGGTNVTESGGRLNLTTSTGAAAWYGIDRIDPIDIAGAYATSRVVSIGNQALATYGAYPMLLSFSTSNEAYWIVTGNTMSCYTNVGGTYTLRQSFPYVASTHVYFGIGESGGNLRWITSPDGTNWTLHYSLANPFAGDTTVKPSFMVGTSGSEASTTTLQIDDYRVHGLRVARPHYVSAAGNDSNDGLTTGTAWQTIAKVNSSTFIPGDSILFRGGDTFTGQITHSVAATALNPITYGSYGTGRATLSNTTGTVFVVSNSGIKVQDLILTGNTTTPLTNGAAGIDCYSSGAGRFSSVVVDNVETTGFTHGIILGGDNNTDGFTDVTINNVSAHHNTENGITCWGGFTPGVATYSNINVTVTNCAAYSNKGNSSLTNPTGNGIVLGSVDGALIENCVAYDNGGTNGTSGPVGIWVYDANAATIRSCLAYSNRTSSTSDGGGFDLDVNTSNSVIEYCMAYDNHGAGILVYTDLANTAHTGNVVRYNTCWGNARNGTAGTTYAEIKLGGAIGNCQVYGNTLVARDNGANLISALRIDNTPVGTTFRNNILVTQSGPVVHAESAFATSAALMQGNDYYRPAGLQILWGATTHTTLAAWRTAIAGQEQVSGSNVGFTVDPVLNAATTQPTPTTVALMTAYTGLQLGSGSTLKTAGLDLQTAFSVNPGTRDFYGNTLSVPLSVGSYEAPATTSISNDLDLRWAVRSAVTSDTDLQWRVRNAVTSDSDLRWRVRNAITSDTDLRWRVRNAITSDSDLRWRVRNTVTSDADLRWAVRSVVSQDTDLRWAVRNTVTSDSDLRWRVRSVVTQDADLRWAIRSSVSNDVDLRWGVRSSINQDVDLRWAVQSSITTVTSDVDLRWRVSSRITQDTDLRWIVRSSVSNDSDLRWRVRQIVSQDSDLRWRVRNAVAATTDLRWAVRSAVTNDLDALWRVRELVTSDADLRWGIRSAVTSDTDLQWRIRELINADLDARWRVRNVVTGDTDLRWGIRSSLTSDLDARWRVRNVASNSTDLRWRVFNAVAQNTDLRWAVLNSITRDSDLRWRVMGLATRDVELQWIVVSTVLNVTKDLDLRWRTRQLVSSDTDLRWQVGSIVNNVVDLRWRVLNAVTRDSDLRWAIRAVAFRDLSALWRVRTLVAGTLDARWAVYGRVSTLLDLRWAIEGQPIATLTYWDGVAEVPVTLKGMWDGTTIVPLVLDDPV
jgi:hypothetical protein